MDSRKTTPIFINKVVADPEKINELISDNDPQKTIKYNIYPRDSEKKVIGKKAPKHFKKAIDLIAYSELHSSLDNVHNLMLEFAKFYKEKNPLQDVEKFLVGFNKTESFGEEEIKKLMNFLICNSSNLTQFLDKNKKKLETQVYNLAQQIICIWIEGILLHACIQQDRLKVQKIIFNPKAKTNLIDHPVAEVEEDTKKRMRISAYSTEAISYIGEMESEQSIPLTLSILTEMQILMSDDKDHKPTLEAINYALNAFNEANEKLYTEVQDYIKVLGELKNTMIPNLTTLVNKLATIEINEKIIFLAEELIIILDGLYARSYVPPQTTIFNRLAEKTKEGAFTAATGQTKKTIGNFYHKGANTLRKSIELYKKNAKDNSTVQPAISSPAATITQFEQMEELTMFSKNEGKLPTTNATKGIATLEQPVKKEKEEKFETSVLTNQNQEPKERKKFNFTVNLSDDIQFTLSISSDNPDDLKKYLNNQNNLMVLKNFFEGKIKNLQPEIETKLKPEEENEIEFWLLLDHDRTLEKKAKINSLRNAINSFNLSERQNQSLGYLVEHAISKIEGYQKDTYLKNVLEYFGTKIPRYNDIFAEDAIKRLKQLEFEEPPNDPKNALLILFDERKKLGNSLDLLKCIEDLLKEAYDHLLNKVPESLKNKNNLKMKNYSLKENQGTLFAAQSSMAPKPKIGFTPQLDNGLQKR